jgi:GAF domain-containing protein
MTTEKKGRRRSDQPPVDLAAELKLKRDSFVHTFFKKGAEFTEELLGENERLRKAMGELEQQNAVLRTQLASDKAIRDLLEKIELLEREKRDILSSMHEAEAVSTRFVHSHAQIEEEVSNLAALHVASWHLHSTLKLPLVVRHLRELLAQLVGARSFAIYLADFDGAGAARTLVPVASEGMDRNRPAKLTVGTLDSVGDGADGMIERVYLTGVPHVVEGLFTDAEVAVPAACLPMRVDDRAIGVIVIHTVLPQKDRFVAVDLELFKMLGAHAAAALVGAQLFTAADGKLPGLEVFSSFDAHTSAPPRPRDL